MLTVIYLALLDIVGLTIKLLLLTVAILVQARSIHILVQVIYSIIDYFIVLPTSLMCPMVFSSRTRMQLFKPSSSDTRSRSLKSALDLKYVQWRTGYVMKLIWPIVEQDPTGLLCGWYYLPSLHNALNNTGATMLLEHTRLLAETRSRQMIMMELVWTFNSCVNSIMLPLMSKRKLC